MADSQKIHRFRWSLQIFLADSTHNFAWLYCAIDYDTFQADIPGTCPLRRFLSFLNICPGLALPFLEPALLHLCTCLLGTIDIREEIRPEYGAYLPFIHTLQSSGLTKPLASPNLPGAVFVLCVCHTAPHRHCIFRGHIACNEARYCWPTLPSTFPLDSLCSERANMNAHIALLSKFSSSGV